MTKMTFLFPILFLTFSSFLFSQNTYMKGDTEYYSGKYYTTTGKPMVKRSAANKAEFLRSKGYDKIPDGYQVDHIIPLSEGGSDEASNMQLLTIRAHKRKTANERARNSNSTYSRKSNYSSSSTYSSSNNSSTCGASTKSGSSCKRKVKGGGYCHSHKNASSSSSYYQTSTYSKKKSNSTSSYSSTCGARNKSGGYCKRKVKGGGYCHSHR